MQYEVVLEIIVAIFAVYGIYSAVRVVAEAFFRSKNIVVALEIKTNEDASELDYLLSEAREAFTVRGARGRIIVLLSRRFEYDSEVREIIESNNAEMIIVD